jgi:hypothetical protein
MEFEFKYHGAEHEQYFQGAGTAFTRWGACWTGCGDTAACAAMDAIEQMHLECSDELIQTLTQEARKLPHKYYPELGED